MTDQGKALIARAIADDELWVARARAVIEPDVDCSSIEESIPRAQRQIDRMRALV